MPVCEHATRINCEPKNWLRVLLFTLGVFSIMCPLYISKISNMILLLKQTKEKHVYLVEVEKQIYYYFP